MATLSTFRIYTSNDSFLSLQKASVAGEIQVVLAFARDYDSVGNSTNGRFISYFDTQGITPQLISDFKNNAVSQTKFFLSIGGRSSKYPFSVTSTALPNWIKNATDSITILINRYHLDGVDIYYEHINADASLFQEAIGTLIDNLTNRGITAVTSIAPSAQLEDTYYKPLYNNYGSYITTVVFQSHKAASQITTVEGLAQLFEDHDKHYYSKEKLLAGHSILPSDWSKVPRPIFLGAIPRLLGNQLVVGVSEWSVITNDPEN